MTCKFLAHLPLIVVIKTRMSSQKVYIIRTQCSIRVIVIFFGSPPPHLLYYPVRPSTSILLSIALTNVHIAGQISIERYSWKAHLWSRWREPSLSLLPSGPGNIFLLPAPTSPHLHKIGQNRLSAFPQKLLQIGQLGWKSVFFRFSIRWVWRTTMAASDRLSKLRPVASPVFHDLLSHISWATLQTSTQHISLT